MNSKMGSLEEKVKLPAAETISRFYQPQANRKVIRILTVAVYVFCVSLAAIMLSLYYIFIWDPTIRPFATKVNNCDKIVIPEQIAIRLINSSELSAEQFYKNVFEQYKHIYRQQQLQEQRHLHQHYQHHHNGLSTARMQQDNIYSSATIIQKPNELSTKKQNNNSDSIYKLVPPPSQMPTIELKPSLESVAVPHNKPSSHNQHHHSHRKNINNSNKKHHRKGNAAEGTNVNDDHNRDSPPKPSLLRDRNPLHTIAASAVAFPSGKPLRSLSSTSIGRRTPTAPPINENPINIDDEDYSDVNDDDDDLDYDNELAQEGESSGFFPPNYEFVNRKRLNLD